MKVLQICKAYFPENIGGVEQLVYNLTSGLHAQGIISDVATITKKNKFYETRVGHSNVYCFPQTAQFFSCPMSLSFYSKLKTIAESYDVLNYHFPWPFADLVYILNHINKPFVITYHSDIVRQYILKPVYSSVLRSFFKKSSAIVTTSNNLKSTSATLKPYQFKTKAVPIGMSEALYQSTNTNKVSIWRSRLGDNFFLFIGVLRYYKGVEFLLEAVRHTDLPLVIVGSGPKQKEFQRFATRYHIRNVIFTGSISDEDKAALLFLCYAVVAPAHLRSEAFCITLLEGLVFQKPLISTEIGTGTSFVNTHGVTGLVVPPRNPKALRHAMRKLVEDKKLYQKFKQNTMKHYRRHFTEADMIKGYVNIYKDLI